MDKEQELRQEIRRVLQKKMMKSSQLDESSLTSWVINKVANGLKWATNKKADYQYDGLLNSKEFRSLASRYGYKKESDFVKRAKELVKKDPKKFAKLLAYDVKNSDLRMFKVW